jgi:toxin ParE1/3/4
LSFAKRERRYGRHLRIYLRGKPEFEGCRRFIQRIRDRCERIGAAPMGGRPRDDLSPGLRTTPFERSVVIAYVVEGGAVQITNIFYGGRDYEALYRPFR